MILILHALEIVITSIENFCIRVDMHIEDLFKFLKQINFQHLYVSVKSDFVSNNALKVIQSLSEERRGLRS